MTDPYLDQAKEAYADGDPQISVAAALIAIAERMQPPQPVITVDPRVAQERDDLTAERAELFRRIDGFIRRAERAEAERDELEENVDGQAWQDLTAERDELAEIVANSDHTAAKYFRRMKDAERRMRAAETRADQSEDLAHYEKRQNQQHLYVSTYCQHHEHGDCRKSCKICSAPCLCPCHRGEDDDTHLCHCHRGEDHG